jgi:hypothetical protein
MQTVSAFKKKIVTRIPGAETTTPLDQRGALKIVKVNPSISIQPKKPGSYLDTYQNVLNFKRA